MTLPVSVTMAEDFTTIWESAVPEKRILTQSIATTSILMKSAYAQAYLPKQLLSLRYLMKKA